MDLRIKFSSHSKETKQEYKKATKQGTLVMSTGTN